MKKVAVVAHGRKTFGGGLGELRELLSREGIDPLWYEVPKSKRAPKAVEKALADGAGSKLPIGRLLADAGQAIDIHWCP